MSARRFRPRHATALLGAALAFACGDAPTEPTALLVAEHATGISAPAPPAVDGADEMDGASFLRLIDAHRAWLDSVGGPLKEDVARRVAHSEVARVEDEVVRARAALDGARAAERDGHRDAAVTALLDARSEALAAAGMLVAAVTIAEADAVDARCAGEAEDAPPKALARGRRLLAWAHEADELGDPVRAVQRAHYAKMLLARACVPAGAD